MANNKHEIIEPAESEVLMAQKTCVALSSHLQRSKSSLEFRDVDTGETMTLPPSAERALLQVLEELGRGRAIAVTPVESELSTQQAADILNVSRPYVAKLVDEGALPARKVGLHRRLLLGDVLTYKKTMFAGQLKSMEELAALTGELGLYDADPK
ncbi:helix-turn-helix domain-containing protein [Paludisphaera rhizosphaerae]|uniref:helix-turn-helix domain-containing protein n=1 Tax=Paludisphaera rhizosphaerae TaxID=2711216 RepID=UPI0013EA09A0|nr:helix-turn-helix domain-containing protein [Paludisphaera rhizosphaerae]